MKPVNELTQAEKFTIAMSAGVPIKEIDVTEGCVKIFLQPATIEIVDGQYMVTVMDPNAKGIRPFRQATFRTAAETAFSIFEHLEKLKAWNPVESSILAGIDRTHEPEDRQGKPETKS